jgi:cytochrome c oxidase subunit IV
MSDTHATPTHDAAVHDAGHAHEGHIADSTFVKVFLVLLVCTATSYSVNKVMNLKFAFEVFGESRALLNFLLIGMVSCIKAVLVMYFFMHLKIDWRKIFVFLIPICILAPMVIIVLWPDIVSSWRLAPWPK